MARWEVGFLAVLERIGAWTLWALAWIGWAGVLAARWVAAFARAVRLGRWLRRTLVVATLLAAGRLVPLAYDRLALDHAAAVAAQQSAIRGQEQVLWDLRRTAFRQGFPEAIEQESFTIEPFTEDGLDKCTVSFDFRHTVDFYGLARLPLRIRGRVVRLCLEPAPPASGPEDPAWEKGRDGN